jgi:hypothetical protein
VAEAGGKLGRACAETQAVALDVPSEVGKVRVMEVTHDHPGQEVVIKEATME